MNTKASITHLENKCLLCFQGSETNLPTYFLSVLNTVPVSVRLTNSIKHIQTYAFLDPGSSATFGSHRLVDRLLSGKKVKITLETMAKPHFITTCKINGLEISSLSNGESIQLPSVYSKDNFPVTSNHIPQEDIADWPHLNDLPIPSIDERVDLLIGNNVPDAYTLAEIRTGPRGTPHATRTLLRWIVWNLVSYSDRSYQGESKCKFPVNRTEVIAIEELNKLDRLDKMIRQSERVDYLKKHSKLLMIG